MPSVVNKAPVAHTRGYKFISIRSHHMKEVEKRNQTSQRSPDAIRHQQADLSLVEAADKYAELERKATLEAEIARPREAHSQKLSKEAQN